MRRDAKERGLARAVAPRKHDALARGDFERETAKSVKSTIALVDVVKAEAGWR